MAVGQEEGRKIGRWEGGRSAAWQDERMEGWEDGRMEGWKEERTGGRREEEGWREEADKAVYHDSLERVCPRQTPSRSPSPGRRYVLRAKSRSVTAQVDSFNYFNLTGVPPLKVLPRSHNGRYFLITRCGDAWTLT